MMRIGPIELPNNLILAPMAGVSDRPFRRLCREQGAGLAVSEMVSADTALWATQKTRQRLDRSGEPGPFSVQILGTDPERLAEAARINQDLGADIIDINMGCPAKKVCKVAAGSALLRDEPLVGQILRAVVGAVSLPVTLKIRTGWSLETRNAPRIARIAWESGVAALTIHGRTRACGYSGSAEYDTIREVKASVPIPVIANGDIDSPEKARFVLDYTGADAIMVGRAARGRPWIFRQMAVFLETGASQPAPPSAWVEDLLLRHLRELYDLYGQHVGVRVARKHLAWYCRGRHGAPELRDRFNQATTPEEQQALIEGFFDRNVTIVGGE